MKNSKDLIKEEADSPKTTSSEENQISEGARVCVLVALVAASVFTVLFMQYSQSTLVDSPIRFRASTAVVCTEFCKMTIGFIHVCLFGDLQQTTSQLWKLSVPATMYLIQNNLLFVALRNLDSAVYQVIYQLKTLTTALFSVSMLGRKLSGREWVAIGFLMAGAALAKLGSEKPPEGKDKLTDRDPALGIFVVLIATCTSGFSGVWVEKILKGVKIDLWVRNAQLGFFSVIGGLLYVYQNDYDFVREHGFFGGYTRSTFVVIALNTLNGYLIALTIKYTSNITKAFAGGAAIVIGSIGAYFLFDFHLTFLFNLGVAAVCVGIYLNSDSTLAHLKTVLGLVGLWIGVQVALHLSEGLVQPHISLVIGTAIVLVIGIAIVIGTSATAKYDPLPTSEEEELMTSTKLQFVTKHGL